MLTPQLLPEIQRILTDLKLDGWLLYDFRGTNAIAGGLIGIRGMASRRVFAYIPREGIPRAIGHNIEPSPWNSWPKEWPRATYSSWQELESELAKLVANKKVAMEYSAGDAIPYLDRIPAGVLEMVRATGATVVTSGQLVSQIWATWTMPQRESHIRAGEIIAKIAKDTINYAGEQIKAGTPAAEHELQARILAAFDRAGVSADHDPDVAASENAANPHYVPSAANPRLVKSGDTLLIDLWAREKDGVWADQTWMASMGAPSDRVMTIWTTVRDARDAALKLLSDRISSGTPVRGGEADDAARNVIKAAGFGKDFWHRTGHSIDSRDLHGSGPQIDNMESRDDRVLIPGVGFSIEPGIYILGELGIRTEVNCFVDADSLLVTPKEIQRDLFVV
ncbi:MAG: M24 family metallopeptidase [Gemmatimonadaceae bacterium]